MDHDDKKVRKTACKLLRHTLQSLLQHYPSDSRSLPPSQYGGDGKQPLYLQWGRPVSWHEMDVQWHQPGTFFLKHSCKKSEARWQCLFLLYLTSP